MLDSRRVAQLHQAAKIIEEDAAEGIHSAIRLVGEDTAMALLIAHLRRAFGSMNTFPARPEIEEKVNDNLRQLRLISSKPR